MQPSKFKMNGAESLIQGAVGLGLDHCFANPGTTEVPLVRALDTVPGIKPVLCLFEGVCTGAADGFGRMAGRPALTLLHLGPGLSNGLACLHDARRARSPVVNLVGDHATWHQAADAPLQSDIESLARPVSAWIRRAQVSTGLATDLLEAVEVASRRPGRIATLVIPHDLQLEEGVEVGRPLEIQPPVSVAPSRVESAGEAPRMGRPLAIILGSHALRARGLRAVARIGLHSTARFFAEAFPARWERGQGTPPVQRLPYFPEQAVPLISSFETIILAGAPTPVSFFGYPGTPSRYISPSQRTINLAGPEEDVEGALEMLADSITSAGRGEETFNYPVPHLPDGSPNGKKLTGATMTAAVAALLPPNAIVMDEGHTSTAPSTEFFQAAAPHSYLTQPGGAIGLGLPCAVGAAIACPDRPVITLQADGSAMYNIQALWTMAREGLNIKTIICNNSGYRIVDLEMARAGASNLGERARSLVDINSPPVDWVGLSRGLGVPAARVTTVDQLVQLLSREMSQPGPFLVDAVLEL